MSRYDPRLTLRLLVERYGPAMSLLALAVITFASFAPRESAGDPGSSDKIAHLLAYGLAILPAALAGSWRAFGAAIGILAWSAGIEVLQPWVGRSGSLADLAANAMGIALGLLTALCLRQVLGTERAKH